MSSDWSFARGGALEDTVAELFKSWGFDVQTRTRLKDKSGIEHEIDVAATKKEGYGVFRLAVECKSKVAPIDIKEIRNFNDKLSSLGYSKGVFIATGGFTTPAEDYARSVGLEVWDSALLHEKLNTAAISSETIGNALLLSQISISSLAPPNIENIALLGLPDIRLMYHPFYFVSYHSFTQDRVGESFAKSELVNLESKGTVVLSAYYGTIMDSVTDYGVKTSLPSFGTLTACRSLPTSTISKSQVKMDGVKLSGIDILPIKTPELKAREVAQLEITKNISRDFAYTAHQYGRGGLITTESKTVRPRVMDVGITSIKVVSVPFLVATYACLDKNYRRVVQATTNKIVEDSFATCNIKPNHVSVPRFVCEHCGNLACETHGQKRVICGKALCSEHIAKRGIFFKKIYCREHGKK